MTSCMLPGDRRLAPARKSGMTVLGKVPKPINLPSQKLENQGNDPNVEIVPKGTLTWGSRPSSSATNAWGTASISSPNADESLGSPGTRPSTAGSDRSHEPSSNVWGQNSRPSSASGILASGQVSASSSRPRSAETRPGSSQLSRFADNSVDKPVAWGPAGTTERLGSVSSKGGGFNLSSGDFPTLGSEKNSDTNSQRGHSSQGRPLSSQGRPLSSHNLPTFLSSPESRQHDFTEPHSTGDHIDRNQGTVNTWKADDPQYALHGPPPNMDHWHRDPHQAPPYPNMNIPPPHYGTWHNPQFRPGPADESWYNRGGPPGGPFRQPGPPGNFPVDYPPGPPRPLYCEPYPRPYMQPDRYMGPNHPAIRPGPYPRPMPHEGFYGPPHPNFYGPADREASLMGMPPPQVHNQYPPQNQNFNPAHFHAKPSGYDTNVMNNEQRKDNHPRDNQEQYRVLLKQHDGPERKNDWGTRSQVQETMDFDHPLRDGTFKNTWRDSSKATDEGILKYPEAANAMSDVPPNFPVIKKDPTLLEKVEGLNNKARITDGQYVSKEKPKAEGVANHEELNVSADDANQESRGYRKETENVHLAKRKCNSSEINSEKTEKVPSDSSVNTAVTSESGALDSDASADPVDQKAQRTKMREVALQRAKQRQQEEEERTREQKAKALAKLEELNRRTLAESSSLKPSQTPSERSEVENIVKQESLTSAAPPSDVTSSESSSAKIAKNSEVAKQVNVSNTIKPSLSTGVISSNVEAKSKQSNVQPSSSRDESKPASFTASITIGTIEIQPSQMIDQKQMVLSQSTVNLAPNSKDPLALEKKKNNKNSKYSTSNFPPQAQSSKSTSVPPETTKEATGKVSSRPQAQRKVSRNQHANGNNKQVAKYHPTDSVMWAPVKPQIKNEETPVAEPSKLPEKSGNDMHSGSKAKRAEMERYVPKPQQISSPQNAQAVEKGGSSKSGKQAEPNSAQISNFGWDDNTNNVPPTESSSSSVVTKSYASNKQRKQPYKANKAPASNNFDSISDQHATSDKNEHTTEYHNAGIEHVKSHWQPKSHVKQKDTSQGTNNTVVAEAESQNQEPGRARKVSEYTNPNPGYNRVSHGNVQRGYNANYRNHYDGDKRRNNQHVEYQRAGSYERNKDFPEEHKHSEGSEEGARVAGSRYRGQGRNYNHRGGGNFYARGVGVSARVGNDS